MSSLVPSFLKTLPTETDSTDGDIVTFQVKVTGEPPLSVTWLRCGEVVTPLEGRREVISHGDGWHELIISNITEDDDGEYECRAQNQHGHTSCYGSLYYYQEGGPGTVTDVTLEGTLPEEGDGRQSGLLILIDDGSQTEEACVSGGTNRKSMTVSEQMQGIIEDLTQSTQGDRTGSITLEKDDDQFNSDIDLSDKEDLIERNIMEEIFEAACKETAGSQETLVPDEPSPDVATYQETARSEGAPDPYAPQPVQANAHKWKSTPASVSASTLQRVVECVAEPTETQGTSELPMDTTTVDLPPLDTEFSSRTVDAETPFGVADIPEEDADFRQKSPLDGAITPVRANHRSVGFHDLSLVSRGLEFPHPAPRIGEESSLGSVTQLEDSSPLGEGYQQSKMSYSRSSFRSSSYKYTSDVTDEFSRTSMKTTSVTSAKTSRFDSDDSYKPSRGIREEFSSSTVQTTRAAGMMDQEDEDTSVSYKRSKISAAYEADESSISASLKTSGRAAVGSSLYSESYLSSTGDTKVPEIYVAIMDFEPMETDEEAVPMKEGQQVEIVDATKPRRWLVKTVPVTPGEAAREGWVPACYLEKSTADKTLGYVVTEPPMDPKELEDRENREAVVNELVETEEDFAKDLQYVVENYYKHLDNPSAPKEIKDRKGSIFGNFKDICDFHNNVLIKGVQYHAKEPTKLGKTFLRLERDFDMHAGYCWNEARAQQLLQEGPLRNYFDEHSKQIDDDKTLSDHLKLPIQRLNDYQLLLKEIIKYSSRLNEDTSDLQKALDFIHSINKRTKDLQYVQALKGCTGDILKLGRIIKHDLFDVTEGSQASPAERLLFLFKGRVFVTEKRVGDGKENYHVTNLFKLQEVELVENIPEDPLQICFCHTKKGRQGFPLTIRAKTQEQKDVWIKEITTGSQAEDLGDQEPALLVTPEIKDKPEKVTSKPAELKHKVDEVEGHPGEPELKKSKVVQEKKEAKKEEESAKSVPHTPTESTKDKKPDFKKQSSVEEKRVKRQSSKEGVTKQPSKEDSETKIPKESEAKVPEKKEPTQAESVKAAVEAAAKPPIPKDQEKGKKQKPGKPGQEGEAGEQGSVDFGEFESPCAVRVMSEDASDSDAARVEVLESIETGEDNATIASGSLRSGSVSPVDGAYDLSVPHLINPHYHLFLLIPVLFACYFITKYYLPL